VAASQSVEAIPRQAMALTAPKQRVADQAGENQRLEVRNRALAADVADLKEGREAAEERARAELGMVRPAEVFYQVIEKPATSDGKGSENPPR